MTERSKDQLSLADALVQQRAGAKNQRLGRIKALIDWVPVDRLLKPLRSDLGAPGYPVGVLLRALLLQQWYTLSDPELEEALADRLSFRKLGRVGARRGGAGSFDLVALSRGVGPGWDTGGPGVRRDQPAACGQGYDRQAG